MSDEDKKPYIEAGKKESADYKAQKDELSKSSNDDDELSKSIVKILLCILDLNDPIKFDEKLFSEDVSA